MQSSSRWSEKLSEVLEDSGGRSLLIIKDLDLYPQPPLNTRSPTLNSEEPTNHQQLAHRPTAVHASRQQDSSDF